MTEPGDPAHFAPDFAATPEPYGEPIGEVLACLDSLTPASRVLDIAGGYGRYAIPLASQGHTVVIIDTHEASLREAERRGRDLPPDAGRIATVRGDVRQSPLPTVGSFQAALCIGFLHHLPDKDCQEVFDAMVAPVQPGGRVVIEYSTCKRRRMADGTPILVGGAAERNTDLTTGISLVEQLYTRGAFRSYVVETVSLCIRQPSFWYDAEVIVAAGIKTGPWGAHQRRGCT